MKKWLLFSLGILYACCLLAAPLPSEEVFQASVGVLDSNTFIINWDIKPGYFLYRDRIAVQYLKAKDKDKTLSLGQMQLPQALTKTDKQDHSVLIYRNKLAVPVAVLGKHQGEAFLKLKYQGCADDGYCYPPITRQIKLEFDKMLGLSRVDFFKPIENKEKASTEDTSRHSVSNAGEVESVFAKHHWFVVLLIFFGFGLLLAFTPCVLPMIPVLSSIIIGHGYNISTMKAFLLSLSYVLSMAITYAVVGAVVAMLGSNLQIIMQSPWAISLFSLLFVLLAFSMLGYYELKLPVSWQTKLALINRSQTSGYYISAAIMGSLSTLILSPCVTAPLIGALSYIARSGDTFMGAISLFFLGLGMGTPLLLIGTSARHWLPKAGHWMNAVKYFFAVMLFAVAIYLISRILPGSLTMVLWATLLIFSGIYAGALIPAHTHHEKFKQASGIILLMYGLLILIGASTGSTNPLQPLGTAWSKSFQSAEKKEASSGIKVESLSQIKAAISKAKGRVVMLDFYADWCESCKSIEANALKDPKVLNALKDVLVLKMDVTANNAKDKTVSKYFDVIAPPSFLFFDKEGQELPQIRLVGNVSAEDFLKSLDIAAE